MQFTLCTPKIELVLIFIQDKHLHYAVNSKILLFYGKIEYYLLTYL